MFIIFAFLNLSVDKKFCSKYLNSEIELFGQVMKFLELNKLTILDWNIN